MKNTKMNNLLVNSKKAAMIALLATALVPQAKANKGHVRMLPSTEVRQSNADNEHMYVEPNTTFNSRHLFYERLHHELNKEERKQHIELFLMTFGVGFICMGIGYGLGTLFLRQRTDKYYYQK